MQCPECQHENREGRRFCAECGAPLPAACSTCAFVNEPGGKFCGGCGASLTISTPATGPGQSVQRGTTSEKHFNTLLLAVRGLLQREKRVTYRELKQTFDIGDAFLDEIREELLLKRLAIDEAGKVLVWSGETQPTPANAVVPSSAAPTLPQQTTEPPTPSNESTVTPASVSADAQHDEPSIISEPARSASEAERRQLTVMFCDLADSTKLSQQLDPEDLREVVRDYQETAAEVIQQYEGHIAQYLGDGLLIYFGWPVAHEDDAQRAMYAGLGIIEAVTTELNPRLEQDKGVQLTVRLGVHTGPVVVGEMGGGGRHESLATGETVNIAARLEGLAQANTAVISPVTAQLVQRSFVLEELGPHELKGVAEPMMLYTVISPRETEPDDHAEMLSGGFDALVGRDEEIGLLLRRWEQSKEGQGQVVLISGEAGLGKSSLVEGLRAHVQHEGYTRIAFRCSPYTANSALHPVIEHLQRVFVWQRDDPDELKLTKLEKVLQGISLPLTETVPLVASLLSLTLPEDRYPALTLSSQQQRQQTQDVLVTWMLEEAERQPLLAAWEDLHWADPSTLELIGLFIEQCATVPMLNVLAYRPTFVPPWPMQSHLTPITLNRLERTHTEALARRLAGDKALPVEVIQHVVSKTDGVPLYVEELTKMLLESDLLEEEADRYVLTGSLSEATIPATLQDSLMARLDRLPTVREVAQLGAVLGREFAYEMLHALAAVEESTLQEGLSQLVGTALLYQRGRPPRATYTFRHALIRDTAYQSLLRRTRQQYHQQVAQLLEARFPEVVETQPELVAHHYTEAACPEQAIGYWQQAGQHAARRSANQEAIRHLTTGLDLLATLAETPEHRQQELGFQTALGPALIATKGNADPEVARTYARARELCEQMGDTLQLFSVLRGLIMSYQTRGQFQMATDLGEQLLRLAQSQDDPAPLMLAHYMLGMSFFLWGELAVAHAHHTRALAIYNPPEHRTLAVCYGIDLGVASYSYLSLELWYLGYPDQALQHSQAACTLAQEVTHPISLALSLLFTAVLHQFRREVQVTHEQAVATKTLSTEEGFASRLARGTVLYGWALAMQGQDEVGIAEIRQGLAAELATGAKTFQSYFLGLLAEAYGEGGHTDEGLQALIEALVVIDDTESCWYQAELHRLKGALLLQQTVPDVPQAEACFQQALAIARRQEAKSWELRAATSLARLWHSQGKRQEAYELLKPVYGWFTEGFDTADLKDAKALLEELAG